MEKVPTCDVCVKPAVFNIQDASLTYSINEYGEYDLVDTDLNEYGRNDHYCEEHYQDAIAIA